MLVWLGRRTCTIGSGQYTLLSGRPVQAGQAQFEFKFTTAQSESKAFHIFLGFTSIICKQIANQNMYCEIQFIAKMCGKKMIYYALLKVFDPANSNLQK